MSDEKQPTDLQSTPRTNADIACDCIDKLASECKLNPTAYQREAKDIIRNCERELNAANEQLKTQKAGHNLIHTTKAIMTNQPKDPKPLTGKHLARVEREQELKPPFDLVTLMQKAAEVVAAYPLYKRFIDGTPLENDMATIMATFAYTALCLQTPHTFTPSDIRAMFNHFSLVEIDSEMEQKMAVWLNERGGIDKP